MHINKSLWNTMHRTGKLLSCNLSKNMLSVVLTIYKWTEYTEKTIASLLKNKENPIELVVCMDWICQKTYNNIRNLYDERDESDGEITCIVPNKDVWLVKLRNTGIETCSNTEILIVNDDILLSKWYDQAIKSDLLKHKCVCPLYTEGKNDFAGDPKRKRNNINWHARAIKNRDWFDVWPIDERLKLWYSDDYIFRKLIDLKEKPFRTENCIVHHYRSQTIDDPKNKEHVEKMIQEDGEAWKQILKENWRFDDRFQHLLDK